MVNNFNSESNVSPVVRLAELSELHSGFSDRFAVTRARSTIPGNTVDREEPRGGKIRPPNRNLHVVVLYANYPARRFIGQRGGGGKRPAGIRDCVEDESDRSPRHQRRLWFARRSIKRKRLRRRYNASAELRYLPRYVSRLPCFSRSLCIF